MASRVFQAFFMSLSSLHSEPTILINFRVFLVLFFMSFLRILFLIGSTVFQNVSFSAYSICSLSNISSLFQVVFKHSFSACNMHVWKDFFKNSSSLFTWRIKKLILFVSICMTVQRVFQAIFISSSSLLPEPTILIK